jgi:hypothetical protein
MAQTPFCRVRTTEGVEEIWTVHGHDPKNPETCFFGAGVAASQLAQNDLITATVESRNLQPPCNREC